MWEEDLALELLNFPVQFRYLQGHFQLNLHNLKPAFFTIGHGHGQTDLCVEMDGWMDGGGALHGA